MNGYHYTTEPVPEGMVLVEGKKLVIPARKLGIRFQLAYRKRDSRLESAKGGPVPVGILILAADEEKFLVRLKERSAQES